MANWSDDMVERIERRLREIKACADRLEGDRWGIADRETPQRLINDIQSAVSVSLSDIERARVLG